MMIAGSYYNIAAREDFILIMESMFYKIAYKPIHKLQDLIKVKTNKMLLQI